MKHQHCNIAIQLLPLHLPIEQAYELVDIAIDLIRKSGFQYVISPFETVIEGPYIEIMHLIHTIQSHILELHEIDFIINIKIQRSSTHTVSIDDKIAKYNA